MMRGLVVGMVLVLATGVAADPKPGRSADDLIDWIEKTTATITSLEVVYEQELKIEDAEQESATLLESTLQTERKGGVLRSRRETKMTTRQKCKKPGCTLTPPEMTGTSIEINDGEYGYLYRLGDSTAAKRPTGGKDPLNPLELPKNMRAAFVASNGKAPEYVKRIPDINVAGGPAYGLAMNLDNNNASFYFAHASGILVKNTTTSTTDGKTVTVTSVAKRVDVGKRIAADRFKLPTDITAK